MNEPEEVGTVYQDGRDMYILLFRQGEAYKFHEARFQQFLTRFARGAKLKDVEALMLPEVTE